MGGKNNVTKKKDKAYKFVPKFAPVSVTTWRIALVNFGFVY